MSRSLAFSLPLALSVGLSFVEGPVPTATPTPPPPGSLRLAVSILGSDKKAAVGKGSVAWLPGAPPPGGRKLARPRVASKDKRFEPRITVVSAGSTVDFPNLDKIFHNVFSLSEVAKFDLGLYRNGEAKSVTFQNPGLVRVYCNIHPQMAAFLMVVPSAVFGLAGQDGVIRMDGIDPGRYPVKVWDEKGGEWSGNVSIKPGETSELPVSLDASAWKFVQHKNKYGKDYPPPDDNEDRY